MSDFEWLASLVQLLSLKHERLNIGYNYFGSYVMPVHGLIHDGQLRACPCAILGLMYGFRRLYAITYLGFRFVDDGIKGLNLSFSF